MQKTSKPIRILHCIHSLIGGGAEHQLRILANTSRLHAMHVAIFCINDKGHENLDSSLKIYRSRQSNKYNLGIFRDLDTAITDFTPDIIHAWVPASLTIPTMIISAWRKIPCVFSYRNKMSFHRFLSYPEFILAAAFSSKVVSNSLIEQSSPAFRWLYKTKSGSTIYNAVVVKQSTNHSSPKRNFFKLLFVGRLTKQKNIIFMLEALNELQDTLNWKLDIFGIGELEENIRQVINKLKLTSHVRLRGYSTDIYTEMHNSDLLLFPSLYEGMPNVLLEALAIGLPVLASDIISLRDVTKDSDCVYWFDSNNSEQFLDGLQQFLSDPRSFKKRVENGKKLVKSFSKETMTSHYQTLYRSLI